MEIQHYLLLSDFDSLQRVVRRQSKGEKGKRSKDKDMRVKNQKYSGKIDTKRCGDNGTSN